jgi:hypothetical protein
MVTIAEWDIEEFRQRIRKMTDEKLVQMGKAARYMAEPRNSADKRTVRPVYVTQLQLCREEWRRRRVWDVLDTNEPTGPHWEITFKERLC